MKKAYLTAGVPNINMTLYWKMHFLVGDPAAVLEFDRNCRFSRSQAERKP